mmetsp:Transcript_5194/g.15748  ORF Transcript_5194/g.15748 Transcript_5194/m.15748 type:complete len:204 (-) Transcript_5194:412-1023(-)
MGPTRALDLERPDSVLDRPGQALCLVLVHHAGLKQLLHKSCLLAQHCHRGAVALNGLELVRGLNLPVHNVPPRQLRLLAQLIHDNEAVVAGILQPLSHWRLRQGLPHLQCHLHADHHDPRQVARNHCRQPLHQPLHTNQLHRAPPARVLQQHQPLPQRKEEAGQQARPSARRDLRLDERPQLYRAVGVFLSMRATEVEDAQAL